MPQQLTALQPNQLKSSNLFLSFTMGNCCSGNQAPADALNAREEAEGTSSVMGSAGASSRPITTASEATTVWHRNHLNAPSSRTSLKTIEIQQSENGAVRTASVDLNGSSDDSLIYYDAVDSFSNAIFKMSYPPTRSMVVPPTESGGRGRQKFSLLDDPKRMLSQRKVLEDLDEEQEEAKAMKKPNQRASVVKVTKLLESESLGIPGYPGELDERELQACLDFREELKKRDPAYYEVVRHGAPVEDEAFALCRFLRAREFNVEETFQMLNDNQVPELWNMAKAHDFYRDLEAEFDCPAAVLMTLIPLVISGIGKNGATVIYLGTGDGINVDGVECVTDLANLVPFVWCFLYEEGKRSLERETTLPK